MSISFSGLASGLDTTSWVESLVQLKQAKVDALDERKQAILACQSTLNSIKSFFSSFRSVIEKVTDSKYGVASMDIFSQKLATSSNSSVLTAIATNEALDATYNINVSQLASNTSATSGYTKTTTVVTTEVADLNTKLTKLGIGTGDFGVTVNGISSRVSIGENDTLASLVGKLRALGVDANYNEKSGIFSVKLSRAQINDTISNTGIVDILNLTETGGWESSSLDIVDVETVVSSATSSTKLSELGTIKSGNIEVKANGASHTVAINGNTTLGDLINKFKSVGVDADLTADGVFTIRDAEIVDSGATGILNILGMEDEINSKTQSSKNLSYQTIVTTVSEATNSTKLKDLDVWEDVGSNPTLRVNGESIDVNNGNMTVGELITALNNKGVSAVINNGVISVEGAEISGSVADALGISPGANTGNISQAGAGSVMQTITAYATGETKLSELGITNETLEVHDSSSNVIATISATNTSTLNDLFDELNMHGIVGSVRDGKISLVSSNGSYVGGTMASKLGIGTETIGTTTTIGKSMTSTTQLQVASTLVATGSSRISDFVSVTNPVIVFKNGSDDSFSESFTVSSSTTFDSLISKCLDVGIIANLNDGVLSFNSTNGCYIEDGELMSQLGVSSQTVSDTRTTAAIDITSSAPITYTVSVHLSEDTEIGEVLGYGNSYQLVVNDSDGDWEIGTISISDTMTFGELQAELDSYNLSMSIYSDGTISLTDNTTYGRYVTGNFANAIGWDFYAKRTTVGSSITGDTIYKTITISGETTTVVTPIASSSAITYQKVTTLVTDTTVTEYVTTTMGMTATSGTLKVGSSYATESTMLLDLGFYEEDATITIGGQDGYSYTITVSETDTLGSVLNEIGSEGVGVRLDNGVITIGDPEDTEYITNMSLSLANLLGGLMVGENATWQRVVSEEVHDVTVTTTVTTTATATEDTTLEELGCSAYVTVNALYTGPNKGGYVATLSSDETIGTLIRKLGSCGVTAEINNGIFSIGDASDDHYVDVMYGLSALNIHGFGEGYTYSVRESGTHITTERADYDTTFHELGLTNSYYYFTAVVNGVTVADRFDVDSSTTINDFEYFVKSLGSGFYACFTEGYLMIECQDDCYIAGIEKALADALGIGRASGGLFEYITTDYYANTLSDTLNSTKTHTINNNTKLVDLGFSMGNQYLVTSENRDCYYTVTADSTFGDLNAYMDDVVGVKFRINDNGTVTLYEKDDGAYISAMSSDFARIFKVSSGLGSTYELNGSLVCANTDSKQLTTTEIVTATSATTLGDLGFSGTGTIVSANSNGKLVTTTVDATSFVSDLPYCRLSNGKLYVSPSADGSYIYSMSDNLLNTLNLSGVGEGYSYEIQGSTTYKNVSTKKLQTTNTTVINSGSEIGNLVGISDSPTLIINTESKNGLTRTKTINFAKTDTLNSVLQTLVANGIKATIDGNGKLNLSSDTLADFSVSGSLGELLIGSGGNKTYEVSGSLNTTTITTAIQSGTRDTKLSELGVTAGEYYIYKNGVKYTALVSADDTLGSFIDSLKSFGIQAGIIQNGESSQLVLTGAGDTYVTKSLNSAMASNITEVLFDSTNAPKATYNYSGTELTYATVTTVQTATEDTLLSTFDTPWGGSTLKSAGDLALTVNGESKVIKITADETFGSLVDKLKDAGVQTSFLNGVLYISDADNVSIDFAKTTSAIINPNAGIKLTQKNVINGFLASSDSITYETTTVEEHTLSASNYADINTKLSTLNISSGTLTVYRNGEKALINIDETWTINELRAAMASKFSDIDISFEEGKLKVFSKTDGASVQIGSTTDGSNFHAITGMITNENGVAISARELYKTNANSKVMTSGLFQRGDVTKGDFIVGNAKISVDENTTISDIISQINNNEEANATAYWDSISGKLIINSKTSGAALINIEAGTSNFTDIMGYTITERAANGSVIISKLNTEMQEVGKNAKFTINGTSHTSASNIITSDISKIKGVTLNLHDISGENVTLKIEKDKDKVVNNLEEVVNAYNELMENVDKAIAIDGKLHGETTLQTIRTQLRNYMTASDSGASVFRNLDSIGISVSSASVSNISTSNDSIVKLAFDKDKFLKAYEEDADAVKALLVGGDSNKGVFTKVEELLESSLKAVTGYFDSAETSYKRQVSNYETKINKANVSIERYRSQLEKRFSSMDMIIAKMQQQYSSYLGTTA